MGIKIIILFIFSIFHVLSSTAQETKRISYRKQCKLDSKRQINELNKGILLVRLKTKQKTIEAMRKYGRSELANKTEKKLQKRNQIIINAFRSNFDFCPIYFFYSTDSKHVRNNQLDSITFINNSLIIDKSIKVSNPHIYIAEFGNIEPSKTPTYQTNVPLLDKERRNTYNGSTNFSFKALCIKDNKLNQLTKPFPYYEKEPKGLDLKTNINSTVRKLNKQLHKFYSTQAQ